MNATYFDSDWNNIQNNGVVYDDQGNELPTLAVTNVGSANASGLELEVTYLPTDNLTLNLNVYFKSLWPTLLSRAPRRLGFGQRALHRVVDAERGRIALQAEGSEVEFRLVRLTPITRLSEEAP